MKKFLTIVLVVLNTHTFAQLNPITAINITLPSNPDANTANWGTGTSMFMVSANAVAAKGAVLDASVQDSKILILIKSGSKIACGSYTSANAPAANFNTLTKVWSGANAASLIGRGCVLAPGDYELSVQFFGYSNGKTTALSEEKTKPFTIKGNDQQAYQPPQAIAPANGTSFKEEDIKKTDHLQVDTPGAKATGTGNLPVKCLATDARANHCAGNKGQPADHYQRP